MVIHLNKYVDILSLVHILSGQLGDNDLGVTFSAECWHHVQQAQGPTGLPQHVAHVFSRPGLEHDGGEVLDLVPDVAGGTPRAVGPRGAHSVQVLFRYRGGLHAVRHRSDQHKSSAKVHLCRRHKRQNSTTLVVVFSVFNTDKETNLDLLCLCTCINPNVLCGTAKKATQHLMR